MTSDSKGTTVGFSGRINLAAASATFDAIDARRARGTDALQITDLLRHG